RFPPKRWLLKGPTHMNYLKALFTVFPDACVIQIHRDPLKVIPSISNLTVKFKTWLYNNVEVKETSQTMLAGLEKMLHTALQVRDSVGERHFLDVDYQELVRNPIGTVRNIYDHFGYPFEKVFEEKIRHYLAENQQHKHGVPRYSLEQFGLDADEIKHRFQWYCERFGIEPEK
ncbi:Sulfotransferase, partial [Candidatus Thiomargarita nelsonii]